MNRSVIQRKSSLAMLLLAFGAAGCQDDSLGVDGPTGELAGDGAAIVRILLTDAPADYIESALVDIGRVELVPTDGGEHILLSEDGTDGFVNLLDFQNAATTPIAEAAIEPGSFSQLRLVVEAARVSLIDGYTFRDGSTETDLKVPSGAQTGIKLNLSTEGDPDAGVAIIPGETVLVLDFDVNRSFVLRGQRRTHRRRHGGGLPNPRWDRDHRRRRKLYRPLPRPRRVRSHGGGPGGLRRRSGKPCGGARLQRRRHRCRFRDRGRER